MTDKKNKLPTYNIAILTSEMGKNSYNEIIKFKQEIEAKEEYNKLNNLINNNQ